MSCRGPYRPAVSCAGQTRGRCAGGVGGLAKIVRRGVGSCDDPRERARTPQRTWPRFDHILPLECSGACLKALQTASTAPTFNVAPELLYLIRILGCLKTALAFLSFGNNRFRKMKPEMKKCSEGLGTTFSMLIVNSKYIGY